MGRVWQQQQQGGTALASRKWRGRIHHQLGAGASLVQAHMQAYVIQPQIRTLVEPLTRTNICTFFEAEVWPVAQIYKLRVIIICRPCTRRSPSCKARVVVVVEVMRCHVAHACLPSPVPRLTCGTCLMRRGNGCDSHRLTDSHCLHPRCRQPAPATTQRNAVALY